MKKETPIVQPVQPPVPPSPVPEKHGAGFIVLSIVAAIVAALAWSAIASFWGAIFVGSLFSLPFALVGIPTYFAPPVALFLIAAITAFVVWKSLGRKFVVFARVFSVLIFLPVLSLSLTVFGSYRTLTMMDVADKQDQQAQGKYLFDTKAAQKTPVNVQTLEVEEVPQDIARYTNLKTLVLNGGSNFKYPDTLPDSLAELPQLESLIVYSANKFEAVPPVVARLTKLRILRIDTAYSNSTPRQKPLVLSEDIGNLENLEELYLEQNKITELPKSIGKLKNLRKLVLKGNNLTMLPEEIGNLTKLEELDLLGNSFAGWPSSMRNLTSLKLIYIPKSMLVQVENDLVKMLPSFATVRSY